MNENQPSITQDVVVRNIDIHFWTLVVFLVKLAFAIIPAAIITTVFGGILLALFTSIMSSPS
ncbi:MAG TPA: hypothetical protein EYO89_01775 [Candidatus Dadabacteria bacterium]|nr:hypothetical protein [Candidatus Dadabacteria bacterium]